MLQEDYLMRLIEQFVAILLETTGLMKADSIEDAAELGDRALMDGIGMTSKDILTMSVDEMETMMQLRAVGPALELRGLFAATVLFRQAVAYERAGDDDEAFARRIRALELTLRYEGEADLANRMEGRATLRDIVRALRGHSLTPAAYGAILDRYADTGAFADAEDAVFDWLEVEDNAPWLIATARLFFERALEETNARLESGGLERDEIRELLEELQ